MAAALTYPGDCCTTTTTTIPGPKGDQGIQGIPGPAGESGQTAYGGAVAIASGVESGVVAGLALASVPSAVVLTVQSAVGGLVIYAEVIGAPTVDGFLWKLSGLTDAATYKLHYIIIL